jgi:hypothetical protein|tara:strand:- start:51 stop:296 length:246 start_codon:yes stop_codon:yes gene_type:complete
MDFINIIITVISTLIVSIIWFYIMLLIAKRLGIKKDAHIGKIMCCLILMGPIGWSIILMILSYDMVDRVFPGLLKLLDKRK